MEDTLLTYGIGIAGIIFLMVGWVGIQSLWRRTFREHITDTDVLAQRRSCGNCGCTTVCSRNPEEKIEKKTSNK